MTAHVQVETKILVHCSEEQGGSPVTVQIKDDGELELLQDNDRIVVCQGASVALARIILQRHQVAFQPTYHEEVDYTA